MSFLKKIFSKREHSFQETVLDESDMQKLIYSIYPYFKQFSPSDRSPAVPLPSSSHEINPGQTYNVSGLQMITTPVCADLYCLYAIDTDLGYEIVTENHLKKWHIEKEQLHDMAVSNFKCLISSNLKMQGDTNGVTFTLNGILEAGLILVEEIWDQLENQMGDRVVVAIPSRDVVVATGQSNREMIDRFSEKAIHILEQGDHPLSCHWFIRNNGTWKVFQKIH